MIRFECGCVGLYETPSPDRQDLVVLHCDGHDESEPYALRRRNMQRKSFEHVPKDEEERILIKLGKLVHDGHKFRQMQHLLGVPRQD